MIAANSYFDDQVKSLGYNSPQGASTVGVMEAGDYEFGTSKHETMVVIEGELVATLPGETSSKSYKAGDRFEVEANQTFKVTAVGQTAYLCKYR